jgi:hypothetical protein
MSITIEDESLGKITITPYNEIEKDQNFAIKSLAFIIMICLRDKQDEKFKEMLNELKIAIDKIGKIYNETSSISEATDFDDQFESFR